MPARRPLVSLAPAKVNLSLRIGRRRSDGFHEIDSVLQTLELADEVRLSFDGLRGVTVGGPFAAGTPADESNIAWRAAVELAQSLGHSLGRLSIHLEKRIPPAGGLGGGASDAATALRLLQRAWGNVPEEALFDAANAVGSDVAFFLVGGTARARGRGDRVSRLPDHPRREIVLFVPSATIESKTARMFAVFDAMVPEPETLPGPDAPIALVSTTKDVVNTFEELAPSVFPGLADLQAAIQIRISERVRLAGAGPTLFWIGDTGQGANIATRAVGLPCTVIETATARSLWQP